MKCLVVLAIAFAVFVAANEEWKPITDDAVSFKIHEDCGKEAGLTAEQNEKALKIEYTDEKEVHQYVLCCVKRIGVFTEDNGYSADRLMAQYNAMFGDVEKERDNVTKCVDSNEQKSTTAAWAYRVVECIMNTKIGELLRKKQLINS